MIKLAFKLASFFWLIAPCIYLVGRWLGIWDFNYDIGIFIFLMIMFTICAYLSYEGD